MLIHYTFRPTFSNSVIPLHFFVHFHSQKTLKRLHCFRFRRNQSSLPPMPPKIVAEYAKSNRSSCKKCSETIAAKALRLGLVNSDARGFDMTKWHHVDCFPISSETIDSAESIQGFSSLQDSDREALKKLVVKCKKSLEEDSDRSNEGSRKRNSKGLMKTDDDEEEVELEGSKSKIVPKIVAEYAKSNRYSCKKCSKMIPAKSLCLGLLTRDSRGFDLTKWHHIGCCPYSSLAIDSAESIQGFSLLQSDDQEALEELIMKHKMSLDEVSDGTKEGSTKRVLMVHKTDEVKDEVELEERDSERIEMSNPDEDFNLEIAFSVSDIKGKYKDATLLPNWKAFQTMIYLERDDGLHDSKKIAGFDFDGCLVKTNVKIVGADAWSLMYPSVPDKLQSLYNDGYKLVIFTNESNIDRWKNKRQVAVDSKLGRLSNFIKRVKVPMQVFVACGLGGDAEDLFRKPKTGMWQIMKKYFNSGIAIDMDQSFYVGDAAGRENDHSDADVKFAQATGLKFYVPEEYFLA